MCTRAGTALLVHDNTPKSTEGDVSLAGESRTDLCQRLGPTDRHGVPAPRASEHVTLAVVFRRLVDVSLRKLYSALVPRQDSGTYPLPVGERVAQHHNVVVHR